MEAQALQKQQGVVCSLRREGEADAQVVRSEGAGWFRLGRRLSLERHSSCMLSGGLAAVARERCRALGFREHHAWIIAE
eukprot:11837673-Alexandrium_andersonii.AAC.1